MPSSDSCITYKILNSLIDRKDSPYLLARPKYFTQQTYSSVIYETLQNIFRKRYTLFMKCVCYTLQKRRNSAPDSGYDNLFYSATNRSRPVGKVNQSERCLRTKDSALFSQSNKITLRKKKNSSE